MIREAQATCVRLADDALKVAESSQTPGVHVFHGFWMAKRPLNLCKNHLKAIKKPSKSHQRTSSNAICKPRKESLLP